MITKHIPGRVQITTECNHDCIFCSVQKNPLRRLSLDMIQKSLKRLKKEGVTDLSITGGEPLLHPDFMDIIKVIQKTDFSEVTIQTNGSLISEKIVKVLQKYNNIKFFVSFHAPSARIFSDITKTGTYEDVLEGIRLLGNNDHIDLQLAIVINQLNYNHLLSLGEFINDKFPFVSHLSINYVDPIGSALENPSCVPDLYYTEYHISQFVYFLKKKNISFRLEKIPLCYMKGFEEYSTETRLIVKEEKRLTLFSQENLFRKILRDSKRKYVKSSDCDICSLNSICVGLNKDYESIKGNKEIHPVFSSAKEVIRRILIK
jgi:MoaA/NifB/PqqE/SkfB family radical SAM enzyme